MKILHLIDSGGLYGAEKMLLSLVAEQRSQGIDAMILSAGEPGIPSKAIEDEARRLGLPVTPWRMKPGLNIRSALRIARWANAEAFDLMHSHGYKFNILMGLLPRQIRKLPVIASLHGYVHARRWSKLWAYELLDQLILPRLDSVCLVSGHMRHLPILSRIDPRRVAVVENGIQETPCPDEKNTCDPQPQLSEDTFNMVVIGRLSAEKNISALLKVLASSSIKTLSFHLYVIGEGSLRLDLEREVNSLGLSKFVSFLGYRSDVSELMKSMDLLIMPSLTEGLPITLLEAMRCGLPIMASSVGGIPEALDQGRGGILFDVEGDFSDLLYGVISGECEIEKLAMHAQFRFQSIYSAKAMTKGYVQIYQALMGCLANKKGGTR